MILQQASTSTQHPVLPLRFAVGQVFTGDHGQRVEIVRITRKRIAVTGVARGCVCRLSAVRLRAHLIAIGATLTSAAPEVAVIEGDEPAVIQAIWGPIYDLLGS